MRAEPRRGPAVLVVDPALAGIERPRRRLERPRAKIVDEVDERRGSLERRRLVRYAHLECPETGMRSYVPPEARVVRRETGCRHALDEPLPVGIRLQGRRRTATRKKREHLGANRQHPRLTPFEVRRVRRQRQHEREPGEDCLHDAETRVGVGHSDVDVQAADSLPARSRAGVRNEVAVALGRGDVELGGNCGRVTVFVYKKRRGDGPRSGDPSPHWKDCFA